MLYFIRDDNNHLLGFKYKNETYYYQKNIQEDIVGIYNNNYEIIATSEYDSWGQVLSIKDLKNQEIIDETYITYINPYRYRNYYYDKETQLYYLNSRYYNPLWGRFINADGLIGDGQNYNLYMYAHNNSIKNYDPTGAWIEVQGGWRAQSGDTLWGLSVKLYKNGTKWTSFNFNRDPKTLHN